MKLLRVLNVAMIALTLCIVSCSPEDGKDGINGINGADGANGIGIDGADGENGIDGENGVGFDELTKYGFITMELEGTRADGVPFTDSSSFNFVSTANTSLNSVSIDDKDDSTEFNFTVVRFLSSPDDQFQNTTLDFALTFEILKNDNSQQINYNQFVLTGYTVVGDDNKYFPLSIFPDPDAAVITDLNFDEETNNLTFSYAFFIESSDNVTNNDLNISGTVDVTVLEQVEEVIQP